MLYSARPCSARRGACRVCWAPPSRTAYGTRACLKRWRRRARPPASAAPASRQGTGVIALHWECQQPGSQCGLPKVVHFDSSAGGAYNKQRRGAPRKGVPAVSKHTCSLAKGEGAQQSTDNRGRNRGMASLTCGPTGAGRQLSAAHLRLVKVLIVVGLQRGGEQPREGRARARARAAAPPRPRAATQCPSRASRQRAPPAAARPSAPARPRAAAARPCPAPARSSAAPPPAHRAGPALTGCRC